MKIALTGGGTGGHRVPLVAVAQALRAQNPKVNLFYIGEEADGQAAEIRSLRVPVFTIHAGKLRRYFDLKTVRDAVRVIKGYGQAKRILQQEKPVVLFSKGGYVSVPVVMAAAKLKIPIITHESDVVMGLANRLTARYATTIATAYPIEHYRSLPKSKLQCTGNLIREELVKFAAQSPTKQKFSVGGRAVDLDRPIIVVLGGSQGAHRVNELVSSLLPALLTTFTVIHQSGKGDSAWLQQKRKGLPAEMAPHYYPVATLDVEELGHTLSHAFIIISRAGSVISELALFAKPTILIPLPTSAGGHQLRNATVFANKNAALLLHEPSLSAAQLQEVLEKLYKSADRRDRLVTNMKKLQEKNGAAAVAKILLSYDKKE